MSGKMGLIQRISELNYFDEDLFYEDVKELISIGSYNLDLHPEKFYVFLYSVDNGQFEKLDILWVCESLKYSVKHLFIPQKRLMIYGSQNNEFSIYFHGKEYRQSCDYFQSGDWVVNYCDDYAVKKCFSVS
jgi:hypothetical protein